MSTQINVWLRANLARRQMSQRMLAIRAGVDHSSVSRILNEQRDPYFKTVAAMSKVLKDCPICDHREME